MNFKQWVEQHNPDLDWDWDSPKLLNEQLIDTIKGSGCLDLKTLFELFFCDGEPGITVEQVGRFQDQTDY